MAQIVYLIARELNSNLETFMKRLLIKSAYALLAGILILTFSACNNTPNNATISNGDDKTGGEPTAEPPIISEPRTEILFSVSKSDLGDKGYYWMKIDYETCEDRVYKVTYPLYFNTRGNEVGWNIYVFDSDSSKGGTEEFKIVREPDLKDSGYIEVESGQWIYVTFNSDSEESDTTNEGWSELEASYFEGMVSYDDVSLIFMYFKTRGEDYFQGAFEKRIFGHFEIFDITGDGADDLCTLEMTGSGMSRVVCIVYDAVNDKKYVLDGYDYSYSVKGIENGKLVVVVTGPYGYNDPLVETEGTLTIENDMLMFVPDRKYFPEVEPGNTYTLETMTDIITTKYCNVEPSYEYEVSLNEDGNYVFHIYKVVEKEDGPIIWTVDWITVSPTTGFAYTYKGITFNLSDYVNE